MSRMSALPAAASWLGLGVVVGTLTVAATQTQAPAQTPSAPQATMLPPPAQQAVAPPNPRVFGSDAGLVLNFVKTEKAADFEGVIAKVKEALAKSDKPERKQQAASWKTYKAIEAGPPGTTLYVFFIDPPVKGADYTISTILKEAFPEDVPTLFDKYSGAYAQGQGQNFVSLMLVSDPGKKAAEK